MFRARVIVWWCVATLAGCLGAGIVASISGLVVEYIVAIDVTRVRFLADAISSRAAERDGQQQRHHMPRTVCVGFRIATWTGHAGGCGLLRDHWAVKLLSVLVWLQFLFAAGEAPL